MKTRDFIYRQPIFQGSPKSIPLEIAQLYAMRCALCAMPFPFAPSNPCLRIYYCSLKTMVPESQSCQARLPAVNPAQMNPRKAGRAETR